MTTNKELSNRINRLRRTEYSLNASLYQRRMAFEEINKLGLENKTARVIYTQLTKFNPRNTTDKLGCEHRLRVKIWRLVTGNM